MTVSIEMFLQAILDFIAQLTAFEQTLNLILAIIGWFTIAPA